MSPYEALYEIAELIHIRLGDELGKKFAEELPKASDEKFGKFDYVVFPSTNDPTGYIDPKGNVKSPLEIVVYNPQLQRAVT